MIVAIFLKFIFHKIVQRKQFTDYKLLHPG